MVEILIDGARCDLEAGYTLQKISSRSMARRCEKPQNSSRDEA